MNVPLSRLEADTPFQLGRASEISRDELKFSRFIDKLRNRFSTLFYQILEKQLILKNITSADEWPELKQRIKIIFAKDNHFTELKDAELMQDRINLLRDVEEYTGKYYSKQYVRKFILRQTDEVQREIDQQMKDEKDADGDGQDDDDMFASVSGGKVPEINPSEPLLLQSNKVLKLKKGKI